MSGVSTFDLLGEMPSAQRTLMRLFLRHIEMSAADLESKVAELTGLGQFGLLLDPSHDRRRACDVFSIYAKQINAI